MAPTHPAIASTEEIIAEFKAGRMVVLVDEEDRENEGDLVIAADFVSPEAINFMARHGRGLICLTITEARSRQLGLSPMTRDNRSPYSTAFTASIEAAQGVTTGISAQDRALTIRAAVAANARPEDLVQPGHVFPIIARTGGVLVRAGHTEAGCDFAQISGLTPAAVICEILKEDGSMARLPDLIEFAAQHQLKIGTIVDLIQHRANSESLIDRICSKTVTSAHGEFMLHAFLDKTSGATHLALVKGEIDPQRETLVRVHEPLSVLDFIDPDSRPSIFSIDCVQQILARHGGILVLMHRNEDGASLRHRLAATPADAHLHPKWDPRSHGIGAQILYELGARKIRLLSNPRKIPSMHGFNLELTGFISSLEELETL